MKVAFIGGGNMATAILGGLASRGLRGADIVVCDPNPAVRAQAAERFDASVVEAPGPEMARVDVALMAVKPQQMRAAAEALAPRLGDALVISVAAGIRLADLGRWLGGRTRLVRAMPNTPALVHAGITGLHAGPGATQADRQSAEKLLGAVGATLWFDDEAQLDHVTAVSGSGPAYVFYAMEALEGAAVELGIAPEKARSLALWTFVGAAKLAIERGEDPAKLRANVTSKGGTTERALDRMEEAGIKTAFIEAVKAASARSRELGDEFGRD